MIPRDRTAIPWVSWGAWVLVDQAVFSISNLTFALLLARWIQPHRYGAFTLGFSVFLCLGVLHTALLTEPMLVYGRRRYKARLAKYFAVLSRLHWRLTTVGGGVVALGGGVLTLSNMRNWDELGSVLMAFGLCTPPVLFLWLTRRMCHVMLNPREAAAGSGVYLGGILVGANALRQSGWLTGVSAVLLMGAASFLAGAWLVRRLNVPFFGARSGRLETAVPRRHLQYGRWSVGSALLEWLLANMYYFMAPLNGGLDAAGTLRALMNLIAPVWLANSAVALSLVPHLVEARSAIFWRHFRTGLAVLALGSILYLALIVWFRVELVEWLYEGRYGSADLVWPLAVFGLLTPAIAMMIAALRAFGSAEHIFRAYFLSSLASLALAPIWIMMGGAKGAAYGFAVAWMVVAMAMLASLIASRRTTDSRQVVGAVRPGR